MSGPDFARSLISALGVRHADLYLDKVGPVISRHNMLFEGLRLVH